MDLKKWAICFAALFAAMQSVAAQVARPGGQSRHLLGQSTGDDDRSGRWGVAQGDLILTRFRFHDGTVLPQLRVHYRTLGVPHRDSKGSIDNAVLLLHGTGASGAQFLLPQFADELYGPGQPLDVRRYFVILPDAIGHGSSSKPSDGMRMRFPRYDYSDMVAAQYALVHDRLGVDRLRLLLGTSMGCMHSFVWATTRPGFARALMPMACEPAPVAGLNGMWRTMIVDAIQHDPAWRDGDYTTQPADGLRTTAAITLIAGSGAPNLQARYPTHKGVQDEMASVLDPATPSKSDADDIIYQLRSSDGYDPSALLDRIAVPTLWINSGDDFINPPTLAVPSEVVRRHPRIGFRLIPASAETHGHLTFEYALLQGRHRRSARSNRRGDALSIPPSTDGHRMRAGKPGTARVLADRIDARLVRECRSIDGIARWIAEL